MFVELESGIYVNAAHVEAVTRLYTIGGDGAGVQIHFTSGHKVEIENRTSDQDKYQQDIVDRLAEAAK